MIALLASLALAAPAAAMPTDSLDARCHRLMASLTDSPDPAVRSLGLTASLYFLGRIEAAPPVAAGDPAPSSEPARLTASCARIMEESGRDFSRIETLLNNAERPDT